MTNANLDFIDQIRRNAVVFNTCSSRKITGSLELKLERFR
jgi:hypothetical protein